MPVENRGTARNPRWRYAFTIRGVRYRAAVPEARTKYEAEQAETDAKRAVFEGTYGKPTGGQDFIKFIDEVFLPWSKANKRSWYDDELFTNVIRESRHFKGKTFAQISPLQIEKFKRERRESDTKRGGKRSPATVNRELEILSKIFSVAVTAKVTSSNPCLEVQKLRVDNKRTRYLLDEEEALLLAQCTKERAHLGRMIVVAIGTGMRKGDQLNLRWSKVDFQRGVIYVPNQKTGKEYTVPMNKAVREAMLTLKREARDGAEFVFVNPKTGAPYGDIKTGFARACDKAGIRDFRWHDLRHTFGTRVAEDGWSESTIAGLMGHSNPNTTRRYTHATDDAKRQAVESATTRAGKACPKYAPKGKRPPKLVAVNR